MLLPEPVGATDKTSRPASIAATTSDWPGLNASSPKTSRSVLSALSIIELECDGRAPGSALRPARLRPGQRAHLQQHAELVGNAPVLDHLAVLEAADVEHVELNRLARWRPAHDRAGVDAASAVERPDLVPVDDQVDDFELEVREPAVEGLNHALRARDSLLKTALVLDAVLSQQLVQRCQVTIAEADLDQPSKPRCVVFHAAPLSK